MKKLSILFVSDEGQKSIATYEVQSGKGLVESFEQACHLTALQWKGDRLSSLVWAEVHSKNVMTDPIEGLGIVGQSFVLAVEMLDGTQESIEGHCVISEELSGTHVRYQVPSGFVVKPATSKATRHGCLGMWHKRESLEGLPLMVDFPMVEQLDVESLVADLNFVFGE